MGADGVGDVSDADGVEVLVVALGLHKYLRPEGLSVGRVILATLCPESGS